MIEVAVPGARVVFTAREHGDAREADGLTTLEAIAARPLARGAQVHGATVRRVVAAGEAPAEADGQATGSADVAVMVQVADCLPVAVAGGGAVAMLHAGWRGLAAGILEEGVRAVGELGAGGELSAVIGPGAHGCCYAVGPEVCAAFGVEPSARGTLDLPTIAARQLAALGIERIVDAGACTICDPRFHSFRRDGARAGRQAGVAWLT